MEHYTSSVDGTFMRHVLEHNYRWETVLANALTSFRDKMVCPEREHVLLISRGRMDGVHDDSSAH